MLQYFLILIQFGIWLNATLLYDTSMVFETIKVPLKADIQARKEAFNLPIPIPILVFSLAYYFNSFPAIAMWSWLTLTPWSRWSTFSCIFLGEIRSQLHIILLKWGCCWFVRVWCEFLFVFIYFWMLNFQIIS